MSVHPEWRRVAHLAEVREALRGLRAARIEMAEVLAGNGGVAAWPACDSPMHGAERRLNEVVEKALSPS